MSNPFENLPGQPPKPAAKPEAEVPPAEAPAQTPVKELTVKQQKFAAHWIATHDYDPKPPEISPDGPSGKSIESIELLQILDALFEDFEAQYPLEALYAITEITLAELMQHPVRQPANKALILIRKAYDALKDRADIPAARRDEMEQRYFRISRAVGNYSGSNKRVEHDRC